MGPGAAQATAAAYILRQPARFPECFIAFTITDMKPTYPTAAWRASLPFCARRARNISAFALLALALVTSFHQVRADITNGLVAYYNFEGLTGSVGETVVDQSGHGHNGVCRQDQ